ncbi:MAG TPA: PAS domain S-box protein, partial [Spirochaetota bacterium]|nr:PAS domain S-box protein [Spirochaetota bacterium]
MNNEFYKSLISKAPFGYAYHKIILDKSEKPIDYEFLEINSAFEEFIGLKASNILGKSVTSVFPSIKDDKFDWIGFYGDIALNGGIKEFEQFSEHLGRWYKVQVYSSQKYYFSTIFVDITVEKEQKDQLERFFTVNLDLLCIADIDGNFVKTNKAWETILGYTSEELSKRKFLDFVHPDDMKPTLEAISSLTNGDKILNFVNRYRCKDGSYRFIEWRSYPYGKYIYAAARDITERMINEESLQTAKREAEERKKT